MSIDPSQFHQVFFEESFEGLDAMEAQLLGVTPGKVDTETVHAIFRVAHTIKGGGATFGFTEISAFAHRLENLLDEMRDGTRVLDRPAVELLLECVDVLRGMLEMSRDGKSADPERITAATGRLEQMLSGEPTAEVEATISLATPNASSPVATEELPSGAGWVIDFRPQPGILRTGNDVVLMFRELADMGALEVTVDTSGLPSLTELDPEECNLSWRLQLRTPVGEAAIREVFEWVEDECELTIAPLEIPVSKAVTAVEPPAAETPPPQAPEASVLRPVEPRRGGGSIRIGTDKVDQLLNLVGELVITQSMLSELGGQLQGPLAERLGVGLDQLERHTRELQDGVMRIRMLPIAFVFNRFPRMVHDVSASLGKRVDLEVSGESTEVDKTVMEAIGDPLTHLVRNAIDHGLETAVQRRAQGKPEVGRLSLAACHKGGSMYIEVSDDGAGLDQAAILARARERGLIGADETPPVDRIHELLFQPGFSTAETVSDLSGRGVGLDVVNRNVRELGGTIAIASDPGAGTVFTIRLPLTLAILDAQLVRIGEAVYVVPIEAIVETVPLDPQRLGTIAGHGELYRLRDDYIPVHRLARLFTRDQPGAAGARRPLLMAVEAEGRRVGLVVDDLLGQQQVVIKSLEANFRKVEGIAAATILADGSVGLILDIGGLVAMATQPQLKPAVPAARPIQRGDNP